ncbi:hypothetical protein M513_10190 [Trichuris suis]|uniref:Uncharacterized protein n=1 Tax=Trichuris suis TaxID=68888 RepID=A0A085LVF3_9BILA|nr:hypothetical protein M513_10190 [Trichuris suis]
MNDLSGNLYESYAVFASVRSLGRKLLMGILLAIVSCCFLALTITEWLAFGKRLFPSSALEQWQKFCSGSSGQTSYFKRRITGEVLKQSWYKPGRGQRRGMGKGTEGGVLKKDAESKNEKPKVEKPKKVKRKKEEREEKRKETNTKNKKEKPKKQKETKTKQKRLGTGNGKRYMSPEAVVVLFSKCSIANRARPIRKQHGRVQRSTPLTAQSSAWLLSRTLAVLS